MKGNHRATHECIKSGTIPVIGGTIEIQVGQEYALRTSKRILGHMEVVASFQRTKFKKKLIANRIVQEYFAGR
ncbi:MAG: hypothetical protein DRI46_10130 [Chloroflexi bacterium]|nr:MAG: hypothetical protein DRI46_10130 [Chloroflexota bacterium]